MQYPDWWEHARPGILDVSKGFPDLLQGILEGITPHKLIGKNPYLFRAKAPAEADQLANDLIEAFLSSSEETCFGKILEDIAIVVCKHAKGGWKSGIQGIDLEYDDDSGRSIIQIKSGINWGNSSQRKKLAQDFKDAATRLRQGAVRNVRAVEGVCYGPSRCDDRGTYYRIVGDAFWEDISEWEDAGRAVLHMIGKQAKGGTIELEDARVAARENVLEYFERAGVADKSGVIDWNALYDIINTSAGRRPK